MHACPSNTAGIDFRDRVTILFHNGLEDDSLDSCEHSGHGGYRDGQKSIAGPDPCEPDQRPTGILGDYGIDDGEDSDVDSLDYDPDDQNTRDMTFAQRPRVVVYKDPFSHHCPSPRLPPVRQF